MANSFVKLIDSEDILDRIKVEEALRKVPFLKHQLEWFVDKVTKANEKDAVELLTGYCGIKKITQQRTVRLQDAVKSLKGAGPDNAKPLTFQQALTLPNQILEKSPISSGVEKNI